MSTLIDTQGWMLAAAGGALIGLASSLFLWLNGRVAGVSGIFGLLFLGQSAGRERSWRLAFMLGLPLGALIYAMLAPQALPVKLQTDWAGMALAGLIVGFGTRMGNGCTSGHGICGLARFSRRSIVATLSFMASAMLTVFIIKHGV